MDAESVRSGPSHVTSQPALLPPFCDPGGLPSRNNQPPDIWNLQGLSGNFFANPRAFSNVTKDIRVLTGKGQPVTCGERQIPDSLDFEISVKTVSQKIIRP